MVWLIVAGVGVLVLLAAIFWALTVPFSRADDDVTDAEDSEDSADSEEPDEAWVPEYSDELD